MVTKKGVGKPAQLLWASKLQQELALWQVSFQISSHPDELNQHPLPRPQYIIIKAIIAFEHSLLLRIRKSKKFKPLSRKERCSQPRRKRKKKF